MAHELTFTRNGETRTAGTATEAVKLRYDGWAETVTKASGKAPAKAASKPAARSAAKSGTRQPASVTPPAPDISTGGAE